VKYTYFPNLLFANLHAPLALILIPCKCIPDLVYHTEESQKLFFLVLRQLFSISKKKNSKNYGL